MARREATGGDVNATMPWAAEEVGRSTSASRPCPANAHETTLVGVRPAGRPFRDSARSGFALANPDLARLLEKAGGPAPSGILARSGFALANPDLARLLQPAGGDDALQELLRPRLARRAEDLRRAGPRSRITPASRKQTRFAMSRAKPISCVAITIVMPPAASSRITSSTSATSSGSRALVTSSSSSSSGCIASARTIATRCCCPPESRSGYSSRLSARPKRCEQRRRLASRPRARGAPSTFRGAERDVAGARVMCGKRLNAWKTMPIRRRTRLTSTPRAVISSPPTTIRPAVDRLEQVDAAQQRRLAGAGRADQADDLVLGDREVDPAQHLDLAERLVDVLEPKRVAHAQPSPPAAGRGRARPASR